MQIGKTKLSCCSEADLIQGQNIFELFLFLLFFWGFFSVRWLVGFFKSKQTTDDRALFSSQ